MQGVGTIRNGALGLVSCSLKISEGLQFWTGGEFRV